MTTTEENSRQLIETIIDHVYKDAGEHFNDEVGTLWFESIQAADSIEKVLASFSVAFFTQVGALIYVIETLTGLHIDEKTFIEAWKE